jgi:hypothetical protein
MTNAVQIIETYRTRTPIMPSRRSARRPLRFDPVAYAAALEVLG